MSSLFHILKIKNTTSSGKKISYFQEPTDLESQYHVELHADFLIRNERGKKL